MRLNKFACILLALLLVLLAGCSGRAAEVKQADFSFNTPEGYSLSDVTDESCNIVSDEGGAINGNEPEAQAVKQRKLHDRDHDISAK